MRNVEEFHGLAHLFRQPLRTRDTGVGQNHCELLAAITGDQIEGPFDCLLQRLRDAPQAVVAGQVAVK